MAAGYMAITPSITLPQSKAHLMFHEDNLGAISHFGMQTFKNRSARTCSMPSSWSDPTLFNPIDLDTDQWVRAAKSFGAKYYVLVADHFSGFSLYNTSAHNYSVAHTPWRNGNADIIRDFVNSCRKYGIRPGFYYSVHANWHKGVCSFNLTDPVKQAAFEDMAMLQLAELSKYFGSDLAEIWFDAGVKQSNAFVKRVANFVATKLPSTATCHSCQNFGIPNVHMVSWMGNENTVMPYPVWNANDDSCSHMGSGEEGFGIAAGTRWCPAHCDAVLRRHFWFWDSQLYNGTGADNINTSPTLLGMHLTSIGRGCNMILDMSPTSTGIIQQNDLDTYAAMGNDIRTLYNTSFAASAHNLVRGDEVATVTALAPIHRGALELRENLILGQTISSYNVTYQSGSGGQWLQLPLHNGPCLTIGNRRIHYWDGPVVTSLRVSVTTLILVSGESTKPDLRSVKIFNWNSPSLDDLLVGILKYLIDETTSVMSPSATAAKNSILKRYLSFVRHYRIAIVLFWAAIAIIGVFEGPKFLRNTVLKFDPPDGSPSKAAADKLLQDFPLLADLSVTIIVVKSTGSHSRPLLSDPNIEQFAKSFENATISEGERFGVFNFQSYWNFPADQVPYNLTRDRLLGGPGHQPGKNPAAATVSLMTIQAGFKPKSSLSSVGDKCSYDPNWTTDEFAEWIRRLCSAETERFFPYGNVSVEPTGDFLYAGDVQKGTERDMVRGDGISIPVATLVIAIVLRSWRLLIIPLITGPISLVTSFSIMYGVSTKIDVISFAPSVMMSVTIAMSIDYSLFLLSRYKEEITAGLPSEEAVFLTVRSAGHTILVSGLTLTVCFLGLVTFPNVLLSTIGLGASISVFITLIINLVLTPALLYTFSGFFSRCASGCGSRDMGEYTNAIDIKVPLLNDPQSSKRSTRATKWYFFADLVGNHPLLVIIITLGLSVPFAIHAFNFEKNASTSAFLPRSSRATTAYNDIAESFGAGILTPFELVVEDTQCTNVGCTISEEFYNDMVGVIESLVDNITAPADAFSSPFFSEGDSSIVTEFYNERIRFYDLMFNIPNHSNFDNVNIGKIVKALHGNTLANVSAKSSSLPFPGCFYTYITSLLESGHSRMSMCSPPSSQGCVPVVQNMKARPEYYANMSSKTQCHHINLAGLKCESYFQTCCYYIQQLLEHVTIPKIHNSTSDSSFPSTVCSKILDFKNKTLEKKCTDILLLLHDIAGISDSNAAVIDINLKQDPDQQLGQDWLRKARKILASTTATRDGKYKFYLAQGGAAQVDISDNVYALFPRVIATTAAVVMVLTGIAFRSLFIPLRAIFTIAIILCYIYGLTVMVYQYGAFDWMHWDGVKRMGSLGLSLDYDIFLLSRIVENRMDSRYNDKDAVVYGLAQTGPIITAAGLIMAIDTFLMACCLVPAVMILLGSNNWWPTKAPEPYDKYENINEDIKGDSISNDINTYPRADTGIQAPSSPRNYHKI
eukprot:UC4_evm1s721